MTVANRQAYRSPRHAERRWVKYTTGSVYSALTTFLPFSPLGGQTQATMPHRVDLPLKCVAAFELLIIQSFQLQQVILNLIANAVEAMSGVSEGSRELLISTGKAELGGVRVAVRDSGPGLALETLERPFEAFYTTKSNGLGMGLSICHSIIEAHGGRLWATPTMPEAPSLNSPCLPVQRPHRDCGVRRPHSPPPPAGSATAARQKGCIGRFWFRGVDPDSAREISFPQCFDSVRLRICAGAVKDGRRVDSPANTSAQ